MALANFLGKLKGENKAEPKKFLALILTDEVVQAAVWHISSEQTEIVAIGTPVEWDGDTGTTSELVTAVDATISNAVEGLEEEPNEFILGIPHSWTDKNGVLGVKREFINKIRHELELSAIGYVVITDSILSFLKMQEGTPTTSILIQVSRDELTIVLVRLGRIEGIETIGRSDDVVEDVTEGIARFKVMENLPSRIILFNSMHNLDDLIQDLLSVNWQTQFNFLHIPKIESLGKDVAIRALSVAGGSEIAKKLGFKIVETKPSSSPVEDIADFESSESNESKELPSDADEELSAEPELADSVSESDELLTAEEIGFTVGDNIEMVTEKPTKAVPSTPARPAIKLPTLKMPVFKLPSFNLNLKNTKPALWIALFSLIGLSGLLYWLIWIVPKAVIAIHVTPRPLEEKVELTLSTTETSINFADKIVPASLQTLSESGTKTVETTGKKIIGDPAKGEVTIYNRTALSKNFVKGTLITAGSLKFTLDADTLVASKSAGSDYVDVPGKATVSVTASAIGKESNLSAQTEFAIASFGKDSYVAKNESALSGGSSEEVQVVSKDDQKNLENALKDELLTSLKAQASSGGNAGGGVYLIESSAKIKDAAYSSKVGDTAKSLSLNLSLDASILNYHVDDVTTLVNSTIDDKVPPGFIRSNLPSKVELVASDISDDETSVKGIASVSVALLPVVDSSTIQNSLKGLSASKVGNLLNTLVPGYLNTEITIKPKWIPTRLKSIPKNPKNITVNIVAGTL